MIGPGSDKKASIKYLTKPQPQYGFEKKLGLSTVCLYVYIRQSDYVTDNYALVAATFSLLGLQTFVTNTLDYLHEARMQVLSMGSKESVPLHVKLQVYSMLIYGLKKTSRAMRDEDRGLKDLCGMTKYCTKWKDGKDCG